MCKGEMLLDDPVTQSRGVRFIWRGVNQQWCTDACACLARSREEVSAQEMEGSPLVSCKTSDTRQKAQFTVRLGGTATPSRACAV